MKKALIAGLLALLLTACSASPWAQLGLALPPGHTATLLDTHGGFHGDGALLAAFTPDDPARLAPLLTNWACLPLPPELDSLLGDNASVREAGLPRVESGLYFLLDRYPSNPQQADKPLWQRPSYNFTLALWDKGAGILYLYQLDT